MSVKGYTPLSPETVAAMNGNKVLEELMLRQIDLLAGMPDLKPDGRALAIAKHQLQDGFMWLNRALAKPERLEGELESPEVLNLLFTLIADGTPRDPSRLTQG